MLRPLLGEKPNTIWWRHTIMRILPLVVLVMMATLAHAQEVLQQELPGESRLLKVQSGTCGCPDRLHCECCAELRNNLFNIQDSLCGLWELRPTNIQLVTTVTWRNNTVYSAQISPDNAPPICFPIIPQILLSACLRLSDVQQHLVLNEGVSAAAAITEPGNDSQFVHACTKATVRLFFYDLFTIPLGCIDVNSDGIALSHRLSDIYEQYTSSTV